MLGHDKYCIGKANLKIGIWTSECTNYFEIRHLQRVWKVPFWKNQPSDENGTTLHLATQVGDFEIARFIIDNIDNKNPRATSGVAPLHMAAKCGHLEVCKLIMAIIDELIPGDNNGTTPLHEAAAQDYSEVCKFIIGKISRQIQELIVEIQHCMLLPNMEITSHTKLFFKMCWIETLGTT